MTNFDATIMEAEIRRLADEFPEATYETTILDDGTSRCYYNRGAVNNGPPEEGCIFGHAARNVLPKFYLIDLQSGVEEAAIGSMISDVADADWFLYVQENQDTGLTWALAVTQADETIIEDREIDGRGT